MANLPFVISGLHRILRLLDRRLRLRSALIFGLMTVQSLLELGFILTLTGLGLAVGDPDVLRENIFYRTLFFLLPGLGAWAAHPHNLLLLSGIVVVAVSAAKNYMSYLCARSIALLGQDISLAVGEEIMRRYLHMDYAWHLSPEGGNTFQIMSWRGVLGAMLTHLLSIYSYALTILVLFLSLVGHEPVLTCLVLGVTGTIGGILYTALRKNVDTNAIAIADSDREENRALMQATGGIREVLIHHQQEYFLERIRSGASAGRRPRSFISIAVTVPTWILEVTGFVVVVLAVLFMVHVQHAAPARIAEALAMLILTAWRVLPFFNRIVSLHIEVRALLPRASSVLELLERLRATQSRTAPKPAADFCFPQTIKLEDICFRYPGAEENALDHICLTLHSGQKIGLIGPSGGGKSTLAGVLSGLLPPQAGRILLDGNPMTPDQGAALSLHTGFVPQNPFLFAGTLAENIAFGTGGHPVDPLRLRAACRFAAIDFADSHPLGLERPIGENGEGLSGGQAQRVSIARALYTEPKLLIFDEATSALDQANENLIQQTLDSLPGHVTCLLIAHRLTTVEACDRIIWLDHGRIIMDGTPGEVLPQYRQSCTRTVHDACVSQAHGQ